MRFIILAALLVPLAARAGEAESGIVVRPLLGAGGVLSDSGGGLTAQVGVRVSPVLLRLTLDAGGGITKRGYIAASLRAGWLHPLDNDIALVVGIGLGTLLYGFVYDNPSAQVRTLTPEVGLLIGQKRWLGRLMLGITGFILLGSVSHERDFAGQEIAPPTILGTVLMSI